MLTHAVKAIAGTVPILKDEVVRISQVISKSPQLMRSFRLLQESRCRSYIHLDEYVWSAARLQGKV